MSTKPVTIWENDLAIKVISFWHVRVVCHHLPQTIEQLSHFWLNGSVGQNGLIDYPARQKGQEFP
jgi:ABC-type transporter lipoprotein component MlaA